MKKVIIGVACLFGILGVQAQESNQTLTEHRVQQDVDLFFIVKTVDGKQLPMVRGYFIDNDDIESLEMLATPQVDSILGNSSIPNSRAILVLDVNPSVNLLNREQILAHYNIPKKHWSLPLTVDGKKVKKPGTLLGDTKIVDSVRVEDNGRHVAIYTRYYLNHPSMTPKLSDLRVTLDNTEFEKVSSRPAWIEEEEQKRPNPWFILEIGRVQIGRYLSERDRTINSETNQIYRFKETGELIFVTSVYGRRYKERDWDEIVESRLGGYCWPAGGKDNCAVEHLEEKTHRATIFLVKDNKRRSANHILYKSLEKDAFLEITYISDLLSEERMKNLRKILKWLKVG